MWLLDEVRRTLATEAMLAPGAPVWVAVSGGLDSMVLLDVLHRLGHPCQVLHVDHGLRGAESTADAQAVEERCNVLRVPFHGHRVDVAAEKESTGASTQMAARALRLEWLRTMASTGPHPVALAHHGDDAVETALLHWLRGPGTAGWSGIPPRSDVFIRPMLRVRRADIEAYAREHDIPFREDRSNASDDYLRNRIRHHLVPLLEELRAGGTDVLLRSLPILRELEGLGAAAADPWVHAGGSGARADRLKFEQLKGAAAPRVLLHRWLSPLGFHPGQQDRMLVAMHERRTGAAFQSDSHRLVIDREAMVLVDGPQAAKAWAPETPLDWPDDAPIHVVEHVLANGEAPWGPHWFHVDRRWAHANWELRPWRTGDRMRPSGLGGSKLISDVLTDAKVPHLQRAAMLVLVIDGVVAWVPGLRHGEGFAPAPTAQDMLLVRWKDAVH